MNVVSNGPNCTKYQSKETATAAPLAKTVTTKASTMHMTPTTTTTMKATAKTTMTIITTGTMTGTTETTATSRQGSVEGRRQIETSGVTRTGLQRQDPIGTRYHCSYNCICFTYGYIDVHC